MLPLMIESLMREQIDVDLRSKQFRPPRFDQRSLGKSFDGGTIQPSKLVNALWSEIDLLGGIVLDAMRKVLSRAKIPPYSGITEDLLRVFESEVEPGMEDIRSIGCEKLARISGPGGDEWFYRKADLARPAWKVEIKLMGIEIGEFEADATMETTKSTPSRDEAFICYSRANKKWLERVRVHLRPLERRGVLKLFDDTKIKPGTRWREEIKAALDRARVAILLVSADFLASDFIAENELPPLLEKAESGGATILTLIVSPCGFRREKKLADYQAVNNPSKPLDSLKESESEQVLTELAEAVEAALSPNSGVSPTTGASPERTAETGEEKLEKALQQPTHRFQLACNSNVDGCVVPAIWSVDGQRVPVTFFRLAVSAPQSLTVKNSTGFLKRVEKSGQKKWGGDNAQLTFAPGEDVDALSKTIRQGFTEFLDILVVTSTNDIFPGTKGRGWPYTPNIFHMFSERGDYFLTLAVVGDGVPPETALLKFHWTRDWQTSTLTLVPPSKNSLY